MSDIVELLRAEPHSVPSGLALEAAAEIERLRADNARLRAALEAACNHVEWLLRYVSKTGSSDAAGAAVNARDFLEKSRRALEANDD